MLILEMKNSVPLEMDLGADSIQFPSLRPAPALVVGGVGNGRAAALRGDKVADGSESCGGGGGGESRGASLAAAFFTENGRGEGSFDVEDAAGLPLKRPGEIARAGSGGNSAAFTNLLASARTELFCCVLSAAARCFMSSSACLPPERGLLAPVGSILMRSKELSIIMGNAYLALTSWSA